MKKTVLAVIMLMLMFTVMGCNENSESAENGKAVAVVNETEITEEELNRYVEQYKTVYANLGVDFESEEGKKMMEELKTEILNGLIDQEVILQAAQKEGYKADSAEVEKMLEDFKAQFESEEKMQETLDSLNMTTEDLEKEISQSIIYNQYIEDQIGQVEVAKEELEEAYNAHEEETGEKPDEKTKESIKNQLISQKEQEEFQKLVDRLKQESEIEILM
jgi:uncharacterized lipoprotein NlpE involved in copper resistance